MQFICSKCKEKFHYPAKQTNNDLSIGMNTLGVKESIEVSVCPFCLSKSFTEYIEPEADITSVLSCELGAVDGFLKQGYIVKELYAKTATLVKREVPKKENADPDVDVETESEFVTNAREYYKKLHPEGQP
jgi:hypothetical protein